MADIAEYRLAVAFSENIAGVFTLSSALDGTDALTDVGLFAGTFDDVTDDMQAPIAVVFGTDNLMATVQPGNLTVTVARVDDPGYWNPNNPASPLNSETPGFKAMRPVRLQASVLLSDLAGPNVTVSGNEITDAVRAADVQGDGRAADSSFGIWEATSNAVANGGAESSITGWNASGGATLVQDPTPKFGTYAVKVTT